MDAIIHIHMDIMGYILYPIIIIWISIIHIHMILWDIRVAEYLSPGIDIYPWDTGIRTAELISDLLGWEILIFTARARDEFSSSRQK